MSTTIKIEQSQCSARALVQVSEPGTQPIPTSHSQLILSTSSSGTQVVKIFPTSQHPGLNSSSDTNVQQNQEAGATRTTYTMSDCVSHMSTGALPTSMYQIGMSRATDVSVGHQNDTGTVTQPRILNVQGPPKTAITTPQKYVTIGTSNQQRIPHLVANLSPNARIIATPGSNTTQKYQVLNNMILNKSIPQRSVPVGSVKTVQKPGNNLIQIPGNQNRVISNQKIVKNVTNMTRQQQQGKTIKTIPAQTTQNYVKPSGIKTIPAQVNHFNKVQNSVKMVSGTALNQRVGLKTLPPQRSVVNNRSNMVSKPNYIGKHALQAQRSQQKSISPVKRPVQAQLRVNNMPNLVKYQTKVASGNMSFSQALGNQNLQNIPVGTRPEIAYMSSNEDSISLTEDIGEEVPPAFLPNMNYISQLIMMDHNYVAAPPTENRPPALRSPSPPHTPQVAPQPAATQNGPQGQNSPSKSPYHTSAANALNFSRNNNSVEPLQYRADSIPDYRSDTSSIDGGGPAEREGGALDEGEETETAPEGEGDDSSITTCICDYEHDDGWMIQCDICSSWQHIKCMYPDVPPSQKDKLPDKYYCVRCDPRPVDRALAHAAQQRFAASRKQNTAHVSPVSANIGPGDPLSSSSVSIERHSIMRDDGSDDSDTSTADSGAEGAPILPSRRKSSVSLNNNIVGKKRGHPVSLSARRKSEPPAHSRRTPLQSKRRRESAREVPPPTPSRRAATAAANALKKRDKKQSMKRKVKSRASIDDDSQDSWHAPLAYSGNPVLVTGLMQLRQWIDNYEEAVTNHYSPELRARISNMRANGNATSASGLDKQAPPNAHQEVLLHRCKVVAHSLAGCKMVVASHPLNTNAPVIELMGKYMLSTQHRSAIAAAPGTGPPGGLGTGSNALLTRPNPNRPGPFLFFYRLPRDGTEVCVDTRTYGNNARFIRRSCRPNAELRHCVEKGTLHLYVVTITTVDKNSEITIKHESHDLAAAAAAASGTLSPTTSPILCACGRMQHCALYNHRKNGGPISPDRSTTTSTTPNNTNNVHSNSGSPSKRRRGRRTTSPTRPESPPVVPQQLSHSPSTTSTGPPALSTRRASQQSRLNITTTTITRDHVDKEEYKPDKPTSEVKEKKKKMTREERKMEAIVKAFEKMEKAEMKKLEVQARQAQRRESESGTTGQIRHLENGDIDRDGVRTRRKKRKGRTRTTSTTSLNSTRRRTRLNSTDSYATSCDDSSLLSPPLPTSSTTENPSSVEKQHPEAIEIKSEIIEPVLPEPMHVETSPVEMNSPGQVNTAAGLLLALAHGGNGGAEQSIIKSPDIDGNSSACSGSPHSLPDTTPMSSACLLVAAAVGPLEPDFKFPKTKKAIMNEWLNKSPEPIPSASLISPISLQTSQFEQQELHLQQHITSDYYTSTISTSNKSLATLVQAASSLCESPPQCSRASLGSGPSGQAQVQQGIGNAKKRWLRQAISEECDSPCSRPESPPGCAEMVIAPPKKRRLARESLSSEQSFTPPTTPTMLVPPTNSLVEEEYPNNDEEFYTSEERNTSNGSPTTVEYSKVENQETARTSLIVEQNDVNTMNERSSEIGLEFDASLTNMKDDVDAMTRKYTDTLSSTLLDPRLGRERPIFRDSAQLLGTVEKTIRFYEENLTGTISPVVTSTVQKEPKEKQPQTKPEMVTPAKRKLSISEYRQRKQLTTPTGERPPSPDSPAPPTPHSTPFTGRNRSDSTSSTTSSLSSDDETINPHAENKLITSTEPQVGVAFSSAPTTVERQRENVERIKKAFGLARDDENRKTVRDPLSSPINSITSPQLDNKLSNLVTKSIDPSSTHRYREDPRKYDRMNETNIDQDQKIEITCDTKVIEDEKTDVKFDGKFDTNFDTKSTAKFDAKHDTKFDSKFDSKFDGKHETKFEFDAKCDKNFETLCDSNIENNTKLKSQLFESTNFNAKNVCELSNDKYYSVKSVYMLNDDSDEKDKRLGKEKYKKCTDNLKEPRFTSVNFLEADLQRMQSSRLSPGPYYSGAHNEEFNVTKTAHFIPPFNNPVYPNSTQFTGFASSIMDSSCPYEGRNPSPPPSTYQNNST